MKIIIRGKRVPDNDRLPARSFAQMEILDGSVSCADPEGILRGLIYRFWFRPLRFSLVFGIFRESTSIPRKNDARKMRHSSFVVTCQNLF
jgi:hypothetical protein